MSLGDQQNVLVHLFVLAVASQRDDTQHQPVGISSLALGVLSIVCH